MKALIFNFFFIFSLVALHAEDEIYVQLEQEIPLLPVYVSPIECSNAAVSKEYLAALHEVLVFDLHHNGMTKVLTPKEISTKSSLKNEQSFDTNADFAKLKQDHIYYLVTCKIQENQLLTKVVFVNSHTAKTVRGITLEQNIGKDRTAIHLLSDTIFELLFGKKGIASSRILFTIKKKMQPPRGAPIYVSEAYEADYDGHNALCLTNDSSYIAHPQYIPTPEGKKSGWFLYVSYKIGQPKLYAAPLKGGKPLRLSALRGIQVTPGIAKDGSAFAFSCDVTSKADLFYQPFSQNVEVKPRQIFSAKGAANASPSFSPDGKKIAFVSNKDGSPKIYVMDIPKEGAKLSDIHPTLITKKCRENTAPAWSPDGKKIAYCARNSGDRQIWVYDFETNQERELTSGKGTKENPTWAQNSLHLLFNASDEMQTELYLINLNQADAVKITSGPGHKMFPSWEPM